MANILRSKEVYKRLIGIASSQNPLRAVRGLYVSGEHREPYLIDNGITITSFNSSKAKIEDYVDTRDKLEPEQILNFLSVDNITNSTVVSYTQASKTLEADNILNFIGVETLTDSIILKYTSKEESLTPENILNILDVYDITSSTIVLYTQKEAMMQPEPIIYINSISTVKATITNA